MITYGMLLDTSAGPLEELVRSCEHFGQQCAQCRDDWEQHVLGRLSRSYWTGPAAVLARRSLERHDDFLELRGGLARGLTLLLEHTAARLDDLRRELWAIAEQAAAAGYPITGTGRAWTEAPALPAWPDLSAEIASRWDRRVAELLARADRLDDEVSSALRLFEPDRPGETTDLPWRRLAEGMRAVASLAGAGIDDIPADGDLVRARAWWDGLTPHQRSLYEQAYPERVGRLDGLPVTVRDTSNRLVLRVAAGDTVDQHDRADALIGRLEAAQYGPGSTRLYLLDINNSTPDGMAVVSVGNPDTARHQVVIVPGVNSTLDRVAGDIDRAARLQVTADFMAGDPTGDVAVIAWLGYDPPGQDLGALSGAAARAGAPALRQFVDGLAAAPEHHVTVVGHSYGSVVVGAAAAGGGLRADEIITAGSPGMGVDNVTDLRADPRHVWAGAAKGDDVSGWMGRFAHNREPHAEAFGANRFVVDTEGHNSYWDVNTVSLKNQAAIAVGHYDRVSLEHGAAPPP